MTNPQYTERKTIPQQAKISKKKKNLISLKDIAYHKHISEQEE